MKEDRVTAKKRVKRVAVSADANMEREKGTLDQDEDVEQERFMDSRMYMQATQGHIGDFILILHSISSEKELQHSEILSQVSPWNNTLLD